MYQAGGNIKSRKRPILRYIPCDFKIYILTFKR